MRYRAALALVLLLAPTVGCSVPRWPVEGPLTSPFGIRFGGIWPDLHRGVDISIPDGTAVGAMAAGTVRFTGVMSGYGNVVWLDHAGSLMTVYAHLSSIQVREGERVDAGQTIGLSGHSGNARGPHLHFEIWRNGREIDPVPFLGGFPGRGS
jgi:murein DD-endopeptidase MepM/ murein hydrolase activator NlpD